MKDNKHPWLRVALCCLALNGCGPPELDALNNDPAVERTARLHLVSSITQAPVYQLVGRVDAAQTVEVAFEVGGTLAAFAAREGETLPAGSSLARLDGQAFALRVEEAAVQLKRAQQDHDRKASLLDQGGVPRSVVDDAATLLELRRVQLAQARKALADTTLVTPFEAYLAERRVDEGAVVAPGQPIARINDLSQLVIATTVPGRLLATLTPERVRRAEARFNFAPERHFPLRYREQQGNPNHVGQAYEVTFFMDRPEGLNLLPGMTAAVTLELEADAAQPALLWIPGSAVASDSSTDFLVWRYDPASRSVSRAPVALEPLGEGRFLVRSGVREGDLIVSAGSQALSDGLRVRPMNDPTIDDGR